MREWKGHSLLDFPDSYVVVDVETTGLNPSQDHIIEVGALKVVNGEVTSSYSSLINPGVQLNPFITELTGITNEDLCTAPDPYPVFSAIRDFIGDSAIVGHNVHFDINFLYDSFEYYLSQPLCNNFVDTLRLSKKYFKNAPSHKLRVLAEYLCIPVVVSHRALEDCYTTNSLYRMLSKASTEPLESEKKILSTLTFDETNPFFNKRIVVKGTPQLYSYAFMKEICSKCHAKIGDIFYTSCNYIIFGKYLYRRYQNKEFNQYFEKADKLVDEGTLTILSEEDWCRMLNIPVPSDSPRFVSYPSRISAKDISTSKTEFDETHPLFGKVCVFTGTLEKMSRKNAMQLVADFGGLLGNSVTKKTDYLILGNNDYCPLIKDGKSSKQKKAESLKLAGSDIEIITEDVFYDLINQED